MHPPRELAFEEVDAFDRVGVAHDVDAVVFEPRIGREGEQRAVAGVDPDLEQTPLEPHRAPDISAGRRERGGREPAREALVEVRIEDVALQGLAGARDDGVDARQPAAERPAKISSSVSRAIV